jgi:hypothetical protein
VQRERAGTQGRVAGHGQRDTGGWQSGPGRGRWQRPGCEKERGRVVAGCRHAGPGGTVLGGAVQTGFEPIQKYSMVQMD